MKQNSYSDSFKVFLGLNVLLILGNLFLANNYATLWNGTEASLVRTAQEQSANNPVAFLTELIYQSSGLQLFALRLPNVLILLLTALLFFVFGKKIFGRDAVVLTMLVAASSFILIPMVKFGGGDVYLLLAQILHLVFTILYIKQPLGKWRYSSYAFLAIGMLVHPMAMGIWGLIVGVVLGWRHPKKELLRRLYVPIGLALLVLPLIGHGLWSDWEFPGFTFSYGQVATKNVFVFVLLGMLPWLGFLPAALIDLFKKIKAGEELSIVITAWLLASIFSQSLSLVVILSFMIAKQVWVVMKPGYPYLRLVKGFCLLNLISIFILVFLALFGGISWVGVEGYRPLLGTSFVYWVFSFFGVLGLFLKDRRVVIGGAVFSGVVTMLLFWTTIYPKWETYRQLPQEVIKKATLKNVSGVEKLMLYKASWMNEAFMVYAHKDFDKIEVVKDSTAFKAQMVKPNHQIFIFDNKVLTEVDSAILKRGEYFVVKGGWGRMGSGGWIVGE